MTKGLNAVLIEGEIKVFEFPSGFRKSFDPHILSSNNKANKKFILRRHESSCFSGSSGLKTLCFQILIFHLKNISKLCNIPFIYAIIIYNYQMLFILYNDNL